MPGIRDQGVHRNANFARQVLVVALVTATGVTDGNVLVFTPGHRFEITRVRSFCRAKAGAVTYDVLAGSRVCVNDGTTTANTEVAGTLSTTLANRRGSSTDAITVRYTSDGTGALTNGQIVVVYKPWPLNGDLGVST